MAVFKCKMCGGSLDILSEQSVAVCEYCGTKQTLPKLDDEKRAQLYDRANHFRRTNEFDKAMGIYEMILSQSRTDAEAYWGIVLCRYGIEYVEDPQSHKRIPTVNRAQFVSIFDDADYNSALSYADAQQTAVFREEAAAIDALQKRILEISRKETPFDVFICYKESDALGNRTQASVYAQDIYDALTKEGYKVFFSRITLEDKLGSAYEPYIFAALNSAKVMLVVGTETDHFQAVWVKNEWSRFLSLISAGKEKTLIPVYKNISPYDLPEEFQYLQAQDMGKVGFLQDLIRGIKKIVDVGSITVTHTTETTSVIVDTMLKRAVDAMTQLDWQKAIRCYDNVLDYDDKNTQAQIGKMLVEFKVPTLDLLRSGTVSIAGSRYYQLLTADSTTQTARDLIAIEEEIQARIQKARQEQAAKAKATSKKVTVIVCSILLLAVLAAGIYFAATSFFIPNSTYRKAVKLMDSGAYDEAAGIFQTVVDFKDSAQMMHETRYRKALAFMNNGNYQDALDTFTSTELLQAEYMDSVQLEKECRYQLAMIQFEAGNYTQAAESFGSISDFNDAGQLYQESLYLLAGELYADGDRDLAVQSYRNLGEYKDAAQLAMSITYESGQLCYDQGQFADAVSYFQQIPEYEDAALQVQRITYQMATELFEQKQYELAVNQFQKIPGYEDADDMVNEAKYKYCSATKNEPTDITKAYIKDLTAIKYKESSSLSKTIFRWKADVDMVVSLRLGSQTGVTFRANLSGGDGTSTKVKFVIKVDGETLKYCDDKKYAAGEEASCQLTNYMQDITAKKYSVKVYDGSGNLIGSASGKPEEWH